MTSRSLLIVNYHSAALTAAAIESARSASASELQVVVVDNSCDASEASALQDLDAEVILSDRNRGYAGGINLGRRSCRGETLIVSNPDVVFAPRSIDLLADALSDEVAVAGPALFWDEGLRWMLPPADTHSAGERLLRAMAGRLPPLRRAFDRRRMSLRAAFWSLSAPAEVPSLSGAVLAMKSDDFDHEKGFDERFPLYFEETDFLRRVRKRKKVVYVPAARCRHLFNQSAGQDASAAALRFAQSEQLYLEKWNGPWLLRSLRKLERAERDDRSAVALPRNEHTRAAPPSIEVEHDGAIVEASPLKTFTTAAGTFAKRGTVAIPEDVWRVYRGEVLYLRVIDPQSGHILKTSAAVK